MRLLFKWTLKTSIRLLTNKTKPVLQQYFLHTYLTVAVACHFNPLKRHLIKLSGDYSPFRTPFNLRAVPFTRRFLLSDGPSVSH